MMGGMTYIQRPWTPTKRRGPIAAEFASPGPACVTLPPLIGKTVVDSKRGRAPAFSFGSRHAHKDESPGPGPGQYDVSGLSAKGKGKTLALSLHGRVKNEKIESTPAPGDYDPQKAEKIIQYCSPKYSFGVKTQVDKTIATPAPGTYYPEDVHLDKGPQFTLGGKLFIETTNNVPAPGTYYPEKYYSDSSPKYSFGMKTSLNKANNNPAPGTYHIKNRNMDRALEYSFGIRSIRGTSLDTSAALDAYFPAKLNMNPGPEFSLSGHSSINKLNDVPAPNVYTLPSALGGTKEGNKRTAPAYSMASRQKMSIDDRILVPGPGAYDVIRPDIVRVKSAAYTMSGRYQLPNDHVKIPAPGAYNPEKVILNFPPAHTFGIKHSPYICSLKDI